ncbi:nuclear transport factor 2 family protein [Bradyrhizobium sp. AUGA SZCCT0222]|uniref:nuclear transport factor 2 family protein n=1 Tax=Bradyrhizobium sp. AUGA SZCCT0222 TaxID=2807668 RepID=UPI001BA96EE3|nr:nuclear transport factor 2 family protein [Bradyrhizobium sp. AUGA SZCCT0222]MBR1272140.1 nuclear transport factor 2 family protein [Bradyrhizobium sp. AUGA SZCCT0222]
MTETNHEALAIAQTYVNAIANKNVDAIIAVAADGVVCTSPVGRITGTQKFREFHDGFARMIRKVTVLAAYGDDDRAVIVYSAETHPVPNAVTAELIKVENGKIVSTDVIYDATPFAAYMATVQPH